jgi:ferredoxin
MVPVLGTKARPMKSRGAVPRTARLAASAGPSSIRSAMRWQISDQSTEAKTYVHTFGTMEVNVGLLGASSHLSLMAGRRKARGMSMLGEQVDASQKVDADELYRLGTVREVAPSDKLMDVTSEPYRTASQEPDRVATGQGVDEPRRVPVAEGGISHGAGLHQSPSGLRRQRTSARPTSRAAAPMVVALRMITMRIHVDSKRCVGHAQCAVNGPDVFALDDFGYVQAPTGEIAPELVDQAKRGAEACPERAITLNS